MSRKLGVIPAPLALRLLLALSTSSWQLYRSSKRASQGAKKSCRQVSHICFPPVISDPRVKLKCFSLNRSTTIYFKSGWGKDVSNRILEQTIDRLCFGNETPLLNKHLEKIPPSWKPG
ncbi:hypothetical protein TNCT_525211 [Trichonephila clavata]|uniref:Secreted protein n=1 Tax=Trichonephila clavata TaxID=2740835 RepID=A0A8X6GRN2_TRICU|nr:hypothetical protein TNCT_525211 [Trichonephila clavata]